MWWFEEYWLLEAYVFECLVPSQQNCAGRIRRNGPTGEGVSLGWTLRFQKPLSDPVSLCLLPVNWDIKPCQHRSSVLPSMVTN